jgi:hypothetical protein
MNTISTPVASEPLPRQLSRDGRTMAFEVPAYSTAAFANRLLVAAEELPTMQSRRRDHHHRRHQRRAPRQWCRWQANAQYRQSRRDRAENIALSGLCGLFR